MQTVDVYNVFGQLDKIISLCYAAKQHLRDRDELKTTSALQTISATARGLYEDIDKAKPMSDDQIMQLAISSLN